MLADEAVGVEAAFEGDDFDFEVFFGEEGDGFFCGGGPAVSGSKLTMTFLVKRLRRRTCASVKAVPEVAMTLWMPAM